MSGPIYFVGVDVGSASVRAGVYDRAGYRLGFAARPILQFRPRADFVEQSSIDIWTKACEAVRDAVAESGVSPKAIVGLGFDATCSLVAVGADGASISVAEDGSPERDIVMWMDHRAAAETAEINATRDPALAYVGGEVSIEMELPKILWLRRRFPERDAAVRRYFDLADWLVWRSTGADVAGVCALTCKWNWLSHENRFSASLLGAVGLSDLPGKVPAAVLPLGATAGRLSEGAAAELGLAPGTAVAVGIIDAHAGGLALVGAEPEGRLAIIAGTSTCHMVVSRDPVMVPGVWGPYLGAMIPDLWLNEGGQSAAGALLDWTLRQCDAWPELEKAAEGRPGGVHAVACEWVLDLEAREPYPTRDLHILSDHHGNRSPRADAASRGVMVGLTLETGRDALARRYLATLQALAYGTRHIIDSLNARGHDIRSIVMCGGGTKNPLWLREHADACGRDILLAEDEDAVTLGSGVLAAVASGAFTDIRSAAAAMVRPGGVVRADPETRAFHDAKYRIYLDLYDNNARCRTAMAAFGRGA